MKTFDFIYFCIYSFVPDKAIFGKRDVACTFFTISTSVLLMGALIICAKTFKFEINLALLTIGLFGGLFLFAKRRFLLRNGKQPNCST